MKRATLILIFLFCWIAASSRETSIALVVDSETHSACQDGLSAYAEAIAAEGREPIIIEDIWNSPDSIRAVLYNLYQTKNLEGAVFIGNIPIPMIRDAQHLATAFKMNQNRPWHESSIPSDRFYDDFDLKFDFLRHEDTDSLFFYYSLRADSPQYISCDIYSGRIKAPAVPGKTRTEATNDCLKKIASEKSRPREIKDLLLFAGHGYNSESTRARVDEGWVMRHHFPQFDSDPQSRLYFINFDRDPFVKKRLISSLSNPEMDIAILHHHGAVEAEYLSKIPTPAASVPEYVKATRRMMREKVRSSRDSSATRLRYMKDYGVSPDWFTGINDKDEAKADSLYYSGTDLHISDLKNARPQASFIMLDACFNGAFIHDDYISGHYVFSDGATVAVKANSVNSLQDIWPSEFIGLLGCGASIGNWAKHIFTLESHIIGDPTYRFAPLAGSPDGLEEALITAPGDKTPTKKRLKYWKNLFEGEWPSDVRAIALMKLHSEGAVSDDGLIDVLKTDPDPIVRTEAFQILKKAMSPSLPEALAIAMKDSYELLARLSTATAAKCGAPELLQEAVDLYLAPETPARVFFQLRSALDQYPADDVARAIDASRRDCPSAWPSTEDTESLKAALKRSEEGLAAEWEGLYDDNLKPAKKRNIITPQRNKCQASALPAMFRYLENGTDTWLKIQIVEALGWYCWSYKKPDILSFLGARLEKETDPALRSEIEKTINRLGGL